MQKETITEPQLISLEKLKPHEEVDAKRLAELKRSIEADNALKYPIIADKKSNVIIDGEHRFTALKELQCKTIPVIYIDYESPLIDVQSWRKDFKLTKKAVIEAGISGKKLPPKTSKHLIKRSNDATHISAIEKRIDAPLEMFRQEIKLVNLNLLKTTMRTNTRDVLSLYTRFLQTKKVDAPIIIDRATNTILEGNEVHQALDLLTAEKAPAIAINIQKAKIKTTQPITKEEIIKAGVKGPRLQPKTFKILTEPIKIEEIPLRKLLPQKKKSKNTLHVYESTLDLLQGTWPTPLVKLKSLSSNGITVFAKLEGFNPFSNSVKDRVGWAMIKEALENGELRNILYEATSTNTGIALTSIANTLGIKTKLYIPKTIQKISDTYLKALGAEIVRLPINLTVEAINQVEAEANADKATHLNQFENDANLKVHLKHTAKELDDQLSSLGLKPTCIIGGLGTSGHMSAISIYFKTKYKNKVEIIGVQPAKNETIPGIRRIETGMKWYHWAHFDHIIDVTQTEAIEGTINTARKEGILIGLSAGAIVSAFNKITKAKGVYALIFPDTGYKYGEQLQNYLNKQA
ncbi:MAG: pyridoxal-phosphate dependent enzyme [Candidatus Bathyarchaeales archaeon]